MIPVEEAQALVLALAGPVRAQTVALAEASGRVLARPATSNLTQPPFDAAAMDGYAVRSVDLGQTLEVIGTAAAGHPWSGDARAGTAIRIFTGAPVPPGYDRVVMQENAHRDGDRLIIESTSDHTHIRRRGNDFSQGDVVGAPRILRPADIGLLAAMNINRLDVAARPRVFVMASGDELVPPGSAVADGQIVSSNDLAIAAMAREAGADVTILPIARDTEDSLHQRFEAAAGGDLLVTIGGASVGDHDLVGKVAQSRGLERAFYKIAMRPGKPLMAGRVGNCAMIGLPGNPVSAIVCALLFMQPLIWRMQGMDRLPAPIPARLAVDLPPEGPRLHYQRATLAPGTDLVQVTPFADQDSARLSLMAEADALLVRPAHDPARRAGEIVQILTLPR